MFKSKVKTKTKADPKATETRKTSLDLDAGLVAKLRAAIRLVSRTYTVERFIDEMIETVIKDSKTEPFIQESILGYDWTKWGSPERRAEVKAKLERIRNGDRRLVSIEPFAKNLYVSDEVMGRLCLMAKDKARNRVDVSPGYIGKALLLEATERLLATGEWSIGENTNAGGAK